MTDKQRQAQEAIEMAKKFDSREAFADAIAKNDNSRMTYLWAKHRSIILEYFRHQADREIEEYAHRKRQKILNEIVLRHWQSQLYNMLFFDNTYSDEQGEKKIIFYAVANTGKSMFIRYVQAKHPDIVVCLNKGERRHMLQAVKNHVKTYHRPPSIIFLNIQYSYVFKGFDILLETLKQDGVEFKISVMIVFMKAPPSLTLDLKDRCQIYTLTDEEEPQLTDVTSLLLDEDISL
jgi:hypothetical protein